MGLTRHVYDLIIAGAGPAGVTAAIYAARKKMDLLVLTTNIGGQVSYSSDIENYTGFQFITGEELSTKLEQHLEKFKFEVKMEEVEKVEREDNLFKARTDSGEYLGKSIIIATGRKPKELGIPGELEFKNRGITYCATCDAPLFEGMDVAVVGGGNSGLEATLQLVKLAKSVRVIHNGPKLKADAVYIDKAKESGKVEFLTDTDILQITGDKVVRGIKIRRSGKEETLQIRGIFVEIGSTPNSQVVDFVDKNKWEEIVVNANCETSVRGLFAAGDVTNVPEKQIIVAAGEGCKAALSAFRFLSQV
jgi:alkyl hydroperoxide reductase subunit F